MATFYIIALIVGGGLLTVTIVFGDHTTTDVHAEVPGHVGMDASAGGTLHHGVDTSAHSTGGHGLALSSWFSFQFVVYFLAVFGLLGVTLTFVARLQPGTVLTAAIIGGVVIGQFVHQSLRVLKRTGVGSDLTRADFINHSARVTIAIEPARRGEVAIPSRTGERFLAAVAQRGDERFKLGDSVVVVAFTNGVAEVVSKQEYEFISDSKPGANT